MVGTDPGGNDRHLNILLTRSTENGPATTAFFLTEWNESTGFRHAYRATAAAEWTPNKTWPLQATLPGDSSTPGWRFRLDRKSLWIDATMEGTAFHADAKFPVQRAFDLHPLLQGPSIQAIPSIPIQRSNPSGFSSLHLATFAVSTEYLTQPGHLLWLDLDLPGGQFTALLHHDPDGQLTTYGYLYRDANGKVTSLPTLLPEIDPTQTWTSPTSRKTYPLGLSLSLPAGRITIRPRTQNQELPLGRNAFWMGAVEATDDTQQPIARGNMYVFAR